MFTVYNTFNFWIPALSTAATLAALVRCWAGSGFASRNAWVMRPGSRHRSIYFRSRQPDHQVSWHLFRVWQELPLLRWQPVLRVWCELTYFYNFLHMLFALDVAGVVPSKPFVTLNHCSHGLYPVRMVNCFESSVLSFLDCRVPYIIISFCITEKARRAFHLRQLPAGLAFPRWQAVAQARHLAGSGKAVCNF